MLDFLKLAKLVSSLGADCLVEMQEQESALEAAQAAFANARANTVAFRDKMLENSPWVLWPTARPLEELGLSEVVTTIDKIGRASCRERV